MITNFVFVQKMRKIIVTEILNKMSEGLSNSNSRPHKTASIFLRGREFRISTPAREKKKTKNKSSFFDEYFCGITKIGYVHEHVHFPEIKSAKLNSCFRKSHQLEFSNLRFRIFKGFRF